MRHTLKKTKQDFEERLRQANELQDGQLVQELVRTKERLNDCENRRSVLAYQLLTLQKEAEELGRKAAGSKPAEVKPNRNLQDENDRLSTELLKVKEHNKRLLQELADTKRKLEENESETQHAILRKQLDGILKEKQSAHAPAEQPEVNKFDDSIGSRGISETRSHKKANPGDYRSEQGPTSHHQKEMVRPTPKIVESSVFTGSEEDRDLYVKVCEYFERKYPGVSIEQTAKSRLHSNSGTFEIEGTAMVFRISSGSLSVKTGGSFLPINQYFALHPLERKRGGKGTSPAPSRFTADKEKYETAPKPTGSSRSPVPSASGSRRRP